MPSFSHVTAAAICSSDALRGNNVTRRFVGAAAPRGG